jgi:hypothetical protein
MTPTLNKNVLTIYERSIHERRPYLDRIELRLASHRLEKYIESTGYMCPVDAFIEQINFWFPGRRVKRPTEDYGTQLEFEFPKYDPNANIKPTKVPSGEESWDDDDVVWEYDDIEEKDNDLPF